jgi:hypothetical protein
MEKFISAKSKLEKIVYFDPQNGCEELFCKLHNEDHLGSRDNSDSHSCIACQLQEGNSNLLKFLTDNQYSMHIDYEFTVFIILLYLQVEKFHTIFRLIGITMEYVEENWSTLIVIRKWANFIKHPKGFLFTHHAEYIFEDDSNLKKYRNDSQTQIIDFELIKKFYNRESDDSFKNSIKKLGNKRNLKVVIPCPDTLIDDYIRICNEFCSKICMNPHFKEVLKKHSTIEDYH